MVIKLINKTINQNKKAIGSSAKKYRFVTAKIPANNSINGYDKLILALQLRQRPFNNKKPIIGIKYKKLIGEEQLGQ